VVSGVIGIGLGFFIVSNPIGWGTALLLATGSAALSYTTGRAAAIGYTAYLEEVDLVSGVGLDRVCRR
jgi:hypothetical protein